MKTLILIVTACLITGYGLSQKITSEAILKLPPEKQEEVKLLMKQANTARYVSIAMFAGGGALATLGFVMANIESGGPNASVGDNNGDAWFVLFFAGSTIALCGLVPTAIKKTKYNKAKAIIFAQPGVSMVPGKVLPNTQAYGLTITIPLGR